MSDLHGQFCWCELMTTDDAAATAFYRDVIGWTPHDSGMPNMRYTILNAGGPNGDKTGVGGIMPMPPPLLDGGARPSWVGYVAVDDVDASAGRVTELGGTVHKPAQDIPGVGRFAVAADPHGAVFTLFRPLPSEQAPPAPAPGTPGHVGWHELHAGDREAAFAFYADLFGWTKTEAIDLGPMGTYQTFATNGASGGGMVGGMMTKPDALPAPVWFLYFNVDDIDAAVARTKAGAGEVLMGPHEVPGGSWISQCRDPQGALFSMIAPRR